MEEKLISLLREANLVIRREVVLSGGQIAKFYVDVKRAYRDPKLLDLLGESIAKMLGDETCVAAMGYGGIPLATVVSIRRNLPLVMVRGEPKEYGQRNWVDGYTPHSEDRVAIIDDVLTSGRSLRKIADIVERSGAKVKAGYVVVNRGEAKMLFPVSHLVEARSLL